MKDIKYRLSVMSGREVEPALFDDYQALYAHWEQVWSQTIGEVEGQKCPFFSDNFTRQDEIVALFDDKKCIAAICHRLIDVNHTSNRKDSYFEVWPDQAYQKLFRYGNKAVVANQLSVDPEYRRSSTGLRTADLIVYICYSHLAKVNISGFTSASRNVRSTNALFETYRPEKVVEEVMYHGEPTSLYALHAQTIDFSGVIPAVAEIGDRLWRDAKVSKMLNPLFLEAARKSPEVYVA